MPVARPVKVPGKTRTADFRDALVVRKAQHVAETQDTGLSGFILSMSRPGNCLE